MILAIESATPVCSVALLTQEGDLIEKRKKGKGIHSEQLFLFIEELMKEKNVKAEILDGLILSKGPGQFTGLRIGAACAKGFLFSKKVRFLTIGTLEGIAAGLFMNLPKGNAWPKVIHTVLDARRKHLYYQQFKIEGEKIYRDAPGILELDEINRKIRPGDMVAGNGYDRLSSAGNKQIRFVGEECISAKNLIRCYQDERFHSWLTPTDLSLFEPQYLTEGQVQGRA